MKNRFFYLFAFFSLFCSSFLAQNIYEASRSGDVSRMKFLWSLNPDTIKKANENGFSPLIIACYRNQLKVVEFLLIHGVDANYNSPEGTALIGACYKGNLEIAKMLVDYKAEVNEQNEQGTTALIFAVQSNNLELVKLLLESGAKKEIKEKSGRTALDYANLNNYYKITHVLSK